MLGLRDVVVVGGTMYTELSSAGLSLTVLWDRVRHGEYEPSTTFVAVDAPRRQDGERRVHGCDSNGGLVQNHRVVASNG